MARPTPTASFGSSFNAARFRTAIRNAMVMGMPNANSDKATFRWSTRHTFDPQDQINDPYTWTQSPTSTTSHDDVIVPVAWEFSARPSASTETAIGEFDSPRVVITILDVDYDLVRGADLVIMGGNTYVIEFVAPPLGLFSVDVFQLYAVARDES